MQVAGHRISIWLKMEMSLLMMDLHLDSQSFRTHPQQQRHFLRGWLAIQRPRRTCWAARGGMWSGGLRRCLMLQPALWLCAACGACMQRINPYARKMHGVLLVNMQAAGKGGHLWRRSFSENETAVVAGLDGPARTKALSAHRIRSRGHLTRRLPRTFQLAVVGRLHRRWRWRSVSSLDQSLDGYESW